MKTIEINFWSLDGRVTKKEVPVALIREHNGELIAAVEFDDIYGECEDNFLEPPAYSPHSVRRGIRAFKSLFDTPDEAIDYFIAAWEKAGKPLDECYRSPSSEADAPLTVRGTVIDTEVDA